MWATQLGLPAPAAVQYDIAAHLQYGQPLPYQSIVLPPELVGVVEDQKHVGDSLRVEALGPVEVSYYPTESARVLLLKDSVKLRPQKTGELLRAERR
jgi:hypothetical protein